MDPPIEQTAPDDHPEGEAIRRQVEYYFSDENLPTDLHLLKCCGGRENLPVSISRTCGFKKMRGFKPKRDVVAALRKSPFLVVSDDGKMISRKIPLKGPCALDPDFYNDDEIAYDPRVRIPAVHPVPLLPQRKIENPDGISKNMLKPTGFEDTYAEGPITPAEAEEENAMYSLDKPFVERIELAIQRFKQKRRMHEMYALVFSKWMRFGGVDSGPRMFGAVTKQQMAEMNAEEIARATANHNVPWDRADEKHWVVDFNGVAKAFLSSYFPIHLALTADRIKNGCQVLRSFYNYLLYHNVCPEYRGDIEEARALCDLAEVELSRIDNAGSSLPGSFNLAASTILGVSKSDAYAGFQDWNVETHAEGLTLTDTELRYEEAKIVFMSGIAIIGTDKQQGLMDDIDGKTVKVLSDDTVGIEVTSIAPSTPNVREHYKKLNKDYAPKLQLEPLGTLSCRSWEIPDYVEYDLPMDKYPNGRPRKSEKKAYRFWVEDSVLEKCFPGMKMNARILTLKDNVMVLVEVKEVFCSFYTWLPNELEMGRQGPKGVAIKEREAEKAESALKEACDVGGKAGEDESDLEDEVQT
ncbi:hypothetical protein DM02DRAFT_247412 [Periconia macrospinosa]|uniref:HTH La-type RNA-binding domain-containing protein n=1 Tax=Periconia macrospinosa TaxID=97972 RepID=A0A2V1E301_9PLEO|nr:hypothetical protein DM02DRAFT_247412 [Periconia macrospinosa]